MPRFVIDLGPLEMSDDTAHRLEHDLQKVAIGYLAGLKLEQPVALKLHPEWRGLIAHLDMKSLFEQEARVSEQMFNLERGIGR
ncbi:MAG: hypothetical protein ACT4OK_09435 [Gemmobacter sp.]